MSNVDNHCSTEWSAEDLERLPKEGRKHSPLTALRLEWDYSRNQRKHVCDPRGDLFGADFSYLFEIRSCTKDKFRTLPSDGYNLYHKGKMIQHGKTVKELKLRAEQEVNASAEDGK